MVVINNTFELDWVYDTRYLKLLDYLIQVVDNKNYSDADFDKLDLNRDLNIKAPHIADIIYAIMIHKKLEKQKVLQYVIHGLDEHNNVIYKDVQLMNSLNVIDEMCRTLLEMRPQLINIADRRLMALATFPAKSKYAFIPIDPILSQVVVLKAYLLVMVDFCTNGPVDKVTKPKFENLLTYISKSFHKFINQFRKRN
jgi:hypothetical protein